MLDRSHRSHRGVKIDPLLADTYAPARLEELHSDARHRRLIRTAAPPRRRDEWAAAEVVPLALTERLDRRGRRDVEPTLGDMRIGRRGISPVMIGRAGPLARLQGLVDGSGRLPVDDDIPAVALVAGEAGVGKTRLLQELASSVPPATAVLVGQAEPGSLGRPLDVVRMMSRRPSTSSSTPRVGSDRRRHLRLAQGPIADHLRGPALGRLGERRRCSSGSPMPRPGLPLLATYRPDEVTSPTPVAAARRMERRRPRPPRPTSSASTATRSPLPSPRATGAAPAPQRWTRCTTAPAATRSSWRSCSRAAGDVDPDALGEPPLPWSLAELSAASSTTSPGEPRHRRGGRRARAAGSLRPARRRRRQLAEDELIAIAARWRRPRAAGRVGRRRVRFRHALGREARARASCSAGSAGGCTRRRSTCCASTPDRARRLAHHARRRRPLRRHGRARPCRGRPLPHHRATHQALQLAEMGLDEVPDDADLLAGARGGLADRRPRRGVGPRRAPARRGLPASSTSRARPPFGWRRASLTSAAAVSGCGS